jgi:hypothetical protein
MLFIFLGSIRSLYGQTINPKDVTVYSVHVDPLIWDVDPPCEAGNKCKSLMRVKNTNDY